MKKLILFACLYLLGLGAAQSQTLLTAQFLGHKSTFQLQLEFPIFSMKNGVNFYKITYSTPGVDGNTTTASGLMVIPDDSTKTYPMLCYQHGTSSSKTDVPSNMNGESQIPIAFGGLGYLSVTPDYLGLGSSTGFHPYVHAATEASAGIDALRAMKDFALDEGICFENRVFLTGYSQGGHASAALHRLLDDNSNGFEVVAAAHLSGPYSVSVVMRELLFSDEPYSRPAYLINTMFSYQYVYGNLFSDMTEAVKPAYVAKCNQFFNNEISLEELNTFLVSELTANEGAAIASRIFNDDFKAEVEADPNHPVNVALALNDVHDWAPTAPTRLFYCNADDQVPFENSLVAETAFVANGAANIDAVDLGAQNHVGCVLPALFSTFQLFTPVQGTLQPCSLVNSVEVQQLAFQVFPNPADEAFFLRDFPSNGELRIFDMQGRVHKQQALTEGENMVETSSLPDGMYFMDCQSKLVNTRLKLLVRH